MEARRQEWSPGGQGTTRASPRPARSFQKPTTHSPNIVRYSLARREGAMGWHCADGDRVIRRDQPAAQLIGQRRRWESNPLEPGCSRSPGRLAPASRCDHVLARNRTWSSTFARSCAVPAHPEDVLISRSPARESNPALRLRRPPCARHTRRDPEEKCPRQESNLVCNLRKVACGSGTLQGLFAEIPNSM